MGIGSQRVALEHADAAHTFQVKSIAPDIFLIGNLGIVQFIAHDYGVKEARHAVDMINADALALHINPSQEISQPEGDVNWKGCYDKIREVCKNLGKPVIAKEVGTGISGDVSKELERCGVAAIDVSGMGGTSWSLIESYRHEKDLGYKLRNWGIPTTIALLESSETVKIPLIASGGIRNGIDMAKSLALGASLCGMALPLRKAAEISSDSVIVKVQELMDEIKAALFLTGSRNLNEVKRQPVVITGQTREWLELRGIDVKKYARR